MQVNIVRIISQLFIECNRPTQGARLDQISEVRDIVMYLRRETVDPCSSFTLPIGLEQLIDNLSYLRGTAVENIRQLPIRIIF